MKLNFCTDIATKDVLNSINVKISKYLNLPIIPYYNTYKYSFLNLLS